MMRTRILVVAMLFNCFALVGAHAGTPILSGKYTLRMSQHCQPYGTNLDRTENDLATATFNPRTNKVRVVGFADFGTSVQTSPRMRHVEPDQTRSFSNTDATVTFDTDTFDAIYSKVTRTGVAKEVYFQGRSHHKHCIVSGSLVK